MISSTHGVGNYRIQGTDGIENYPHSGSIEEGDRHRLENSQRIESLSIHGEVALTKDAEEKNQKISLQNQSSIMIGEAMDWWLSNIKDKNKKEAYTISLKKLMELRILDEQASLSSFFSDKIIHQIEDLQKGTLRKVSTHPKRSLCRTVQAFNRYLNKSSRNLNKKPVIDIPSDASDQEEEKGVDSGTNLDKISFQNQSSITIEEAKNRWLPTVKHKDRKEAYTVSLKQLMELRILDEQASLSSFIPVEVVRKIENLRGLGRGDLSTHPKRSLLRTVRAFASYLSKNSENLDTSDKEEEEGIDNWPSLDKISFQKQNSITIEEAKDRWFSTVKNKRKKEVYTVSLEQLMELRILDEQAFLSSFVPGEVLCQIEDIREAALSDVLSNPKRSLRRSIHAFVSYLSKNIENLNKKPVIIIQPDTSDKEQEEGVDNGPSLAKTSFQNQNFITIGEARDRWLSIINDERRKEAYTVSMKLLVELGILDERASLSLFLKDKIIRQIENLRELARSNILTHPKRSLRRSVRAFFGYLSKNSENLNKEPVVVLETDTSDKQEEEGVDSWPSLDKISFQNQRFITIEQAKDLWFSTFKDKRKKEAYAVSLKQLMELGILDEQAFLSSFIPREVVRQIEDIPEATPSNLSSRAKRSLCRSVHAFVSYLIKNIENLNKKPVIVIEPDTSDKEEEEGVDSGPSLEKKFWQRQSFITIGEAKDLWLSTFKYRTQKKAHAASLNQLIDRGILPVKSPISLFSLNKIIPQINFQTEATESGVTTRTRRAMLATLGVFSRYLNKKMRKVPSGNLE